MISKTLSTEITHGALYYRAVLHALDIMFQNVCESWVLNTLNRTRFCVNKGKPLSSKKYFLLALYHVLFLKRL